jgi:hypothetical protein
MLPDVIELNDFAVLQELMSKYDLEIKRDPNFIQVFSVRLNKFSTLIESLRNISGSGSEKKEDLLSF